MAQRNDLAEIQDDRLAREFPGTLDSSGGRLVPKLAVAAVLGVLLAVIGGLTADGAGQPGPERLETPAAAGPPAIVLDGQPRRAVAEH